MYCINSRNVHQALPNAINALQTHGVRRASRNGDVVRFPGPSIIQYSHPRERVIFWPERDANPFFHLMECLWMIAGRNDVEFVTRYVKTMREFSDDGVVFNAAYGHRARKHFGRDQFMQIALALKDNPDCRRQVLGIWDVRHDLGLQSKDLPCNTHIYFERCAEGRLNMTVCNRSNDLVWGSLGANAVHFSFIQEYMAMLIGCPVGFYWQFSNNLHGYIKTYEPLLHLGQIPFAEWGATCPYAKGEVAPFDILQPGENQAQWHEDLQAFMDVGASGIGGFRTKFFRRVVVPIQRGHDEYRFNKDEERYVLPLKYLSEVEAGDWRKACIEWVQRRHKKWVKAHDAGVAHE